MISTARVSTSSFLLFMSTSFATLFSAVVALLRIPLHDSLGAVLRARLSGPSLVIADIQKAQQANWSTRRARCERCTARCHRAMRE